MENLSNFEKFAIAPVENSVVKSTQEEPQKRKVLFPAAVGATALAGAGLLAASAFSKRTGAIKKSFGKNLKIRMIAPNEHAQGYEHYWTDRLSQEPFNPIYAHDVSAAVRKLKKGEVGFISELDQPTWKTNKPMINKPGDKRIIASEDKLKFGQKLYRAGIGAKSWGLDRNDAANIKKMKTRSEVIKYLDNKFGKDQYIFKPRSDARTSLPVGIGSGSLVMSDSRGKMVDLLRQHPYDFVGQEKLKILKEYRVRTVGGKYLYSTDRYISYHPLVESFAEALGLELPESFNWINHNETHGIGKEIKNFINKREHIFRLGHGKKNLNTYAWDIAKVQLPNGKTGFKVIEANAVGGSELYNPPLAARLYEKMTGQRMPLEKNVRLVGAGALGTTGLVAGGSAAYNEIQNRKDKVRAGLKQRIDMRRSQTKQAADEYAVVPEKKKSVLLPTALGVGGIAGSAVLAASALRKKPGLIKRVLGKDLKLRAFIPSEKARESKIPFFEQLSMHAYNPIKHGEKNLKSKIEGLKKGEIGIISGVDQPLWKTRKKMINPPGSKHILASEDKLRYGRELYRKGLGARTWQPSSSDIKSLKAAKSDKEAIKYLDQKYGKNKYLFKPRSDARTTLPVSNAEHSIVHSDSKNKMIRYLRKNPEQFIAQEKLDIVKEYRVRTAGGEYVSSIDRYSKFNPLIKGIGKAVLHNTGVKIPTGRLPGILPHSEHVGEGKEIKKFIDKHRSVFNLNQTGKGRLNTYGWDVAKVRLPNGKTSFKIIEANAVGGGEMDNPLITTKLYEHLTGEKTPIEKGIRLAGAGIIGAGGAASSVVAARNQVSNERRRDVRSRLRERIMSKNASLKTTNYAIEPTKNENKQFPWIPTAIGVGGALALGGIGFGGAKLLTKNLRPVMTDVRSVKPKPRPVKHFPDPTLVEEGRRIVRSDKYKQYLREFGISEKDIENIKFSDDELEAMMSNIRKRSGK